MKSAWLWSVKGGVSLRPVPRSPKIPNLNGLEVEYILPKGAEFQLFKCNCSHYTYLHPLSSLNMYSIIRRYKLTPSIIPLVIMNIFRIKCNFLLYVIYLLKCTCEIGLDTVPIRQKYLNFSSPFLSTLVIVVFKSLFRIFNKLPTKVGDTSDEEFRFT